MNDKQIKLDNIRVGSVGECHVRALTRIVLQRVMVSTMAGGGCRRKFHVCHNFVQRLLHLAPLPRVWLLLGGRLSKHTAMQLYRNQPRQLLLYDRAIVGHSAA